MASKMNSISENVNLTTGAVVVMKESLLKAEAEATDYLCKNINGGFLDLIVSQIAQKSALSQSETKAYAMELAQQVKELATLQVRMSKDYAMITKRNISLFNNLNKELENRIIALDKDIIDFVKKTSRRLTRASWSTLPPCRSTSPNRSPSARPSWLPISKQRPTG